MEYYLIGHAFLKIGESDSARVYFEKTGHFSGGEETTDNYNLLFQLMALDQLDMDEERDALLNKRIGPHPDHPYLQWVKAAYEGRPEASAIRDKIMKEISGEWPGVGTYGNETYRMAARMWQVIQIH
jgi:hypothetical protein